MSSQKPRLPLDLLERLGRLQDDGRLPSRYADYAEGTYDKHSFHDLLARDLNAIEAGQTLQSQEFDAWEYPERMVKKATTFRRSTGVCQVRCIQILWQRPAKSSLAHSWGLSYLRGLPSDIYVQPGSPGLNSGVKINLL